MMLFSVNYSPEPISPRCFCTARVKVATEGCDGRMASRKTQTIYVVAARMSYACKLMPNPTIKINEVALSRGYGDAKSVYLAFRGWKETTPHP
ncbi:hypothetical protein [Paracoccus sp. Ld10]|uniref:hypothetical protein n=1 Tax=Paracoccus sp. Ld10 TaxID=649158 RepID=UPI0038698E77